MRTTEREGTSLKTVQIKKKDVSYSERFVCPYYQTAEETMSLVRYTFQLKLSIINFLKKRGSLDSLETRENLVAFTNLLLNSSGIQALTTTAPIEFDEENLTIEFSGLEVQSRDSKRILNVEGYFVSLRRKLGIPLPFDIYSSLSVSERFSSTNNVNTTERAS